MEINRRSFLLSAGAVTLMDGCKILTPWSSPDLRFGVVSDIHLTTPQSARRFEQALLFFKRCGVDAVVVPGDITDWGLRSGFVLAKSVWDRVFADTDVVPLFCTGNHDYEGWDYNDITMEMHANGYSEDDAVERCEGMSACWRKIFGEPFGPVRCRMVKGYAFVSGEWRGYEGLADWMRENGSRLRGVRPFFYFQHQQIRGTTSDSVLGKADKGLTKPVLTDYPNCVAFTGHAHTPFSDERSIWQDAFTAIAVPSLSYACLPKDYENGGDVRDGTSRKAMAVEPMRRDHCGGQGYLVNVWGGRVVVERWDLVEELSDMPAWEISLPACGRESPLNVEHRGLVSPRPCFPSCADLVLETCNAENRAGRWSIVLSCNFPTAVMPPGNRVYDYEIRVVPKDGGAPLIKRFVSPAFARCAKSEPARQRFWFDVAELPQSRDYVIEVRARNCFGKSSEPLVSAVRRVVPGYDKVKGMGA